MSFYFIELWQFDNHILKVNISSPILLDVIQMIGVKRRVTIGALKEFCREKHDHGKRVRDVLHSLLVLDMIDMEVNNGMDDVSFKP